MEEGISEAELKHIAVLAIPTIGFPQAIKGRLGLRILGPIESGAVAMRDFDAANDRWGVKSDGDHPGSMCPVCTKADMAGRFMSTDVAPLN